MRIRDMSWHQVEGYLKRDDRAVLPLGSTEQHAGLSLSVDSILAELKRHRDDLNRHVLLPGEENPKLVSHLHGGLEYARRANVSVAMNLPELEELRIFHSGYQS